jgi:hypothetical protein
MKEKLVEQAKKEGLDYAIIVRKQFAGRADVLNVYKVYVEDGHEEYVRQASMEFPTKRNFKKILAASTETGVYNIGGGVDPATYQMSILSVICPQAVLLEEIEFRPNSYSWTKEEEYVPSPLKK